MSDLGIKAFDFHAALARAGLQPNGMPRAGGVASAAGVEGGFKAAMSDALKGVSQSQNHAERLQRELQLGNPAVSLEEAVIASEKARVGFQATLQVRNRLVQAYSEIMNMQV